MKRTLFQTSILFFFILGAFTSLKAQDFLMDGTLINSCTGFFKDSGTLNGSYGINEDFTTVICSDESTNTNIRLDFPFIDIGTGESLQFFDADTADPDFLIDINLDFFPYLPFSVLATAANPSGCLTVVFTSDAINEVNFGWSARISCIPKCQTIISELVSTSPEIMPVDTGWIDICLGNTVVFEGSGFFPQDSLMYAHSNETCLFKWDFGDGHSFFGTNATHTYENAGIYQVQLSITDQLGCTNINSINQGVRVASYTNFVIDSTIVQTICSEDTINITSSISPSTTANINASSSSIGLQQTLINSIPRLIPNGTGASYKEAVYFTQFSPDAIMENALDIEAITLDIEHSYTGDLNIELICPDGTSTFILNYDSGMSSGTTNFGEPFASAPVDGMSGDLTLGIPYTYIFVENTINGSLGEFAASAPIYTYTTVLSQENGQSFTYQDRYFPAGVYESEQSLANLIGCPLNGEWTIKATDNLGLDNGWITQWSLTFAEEHYIGTESFTPTIIDGGWETHPSIIQSNETNLLANPLGPDTIDYTFWSLDEFGCLSDTTLTFEVLAPEHPDCMTSTTAQFVQSNFTLSPNPVTSELRLQLMDNIDVFSIIEVFNSLGELVMTMPMKKGKQVYDINMNNQPAGMYFLRLRKQTFISTLKKIVKQ